jgi:hypothetical protein
VLRLLISHAHTRITYILGIKAAHECGESARDIQKHRNIIEFDGSYVNCNQALLHGSRRLSNVYHTTRHAASGVPIPGPFSQRSRKLSGFLWRCKCGCRSKRLSRFLWSGLKNVSAGSRKALRTTTDFENTPAAKGINGKVRGMATKALWPPRSVA